MWPTIGGTPNNKLTTEGYFNMATLFPTGAADFLDNGQLIFVHFVVPADYNHLCNDHYLHTPCMLAQARPTMFCIH